MIDWCRGRCNNEWVSIVAAKSMPPLFHSATSRANSNCNPRMHRSWLSGNGIQYYLFSLWMVSLYLLMSKSRYGYLDFSHSFVTSQMAGDWRFVWFEFWMIQNLEESQLHKDWHFCGNIYPECLWIFETLAACWPGVSLYLPQICGSFHYSFFQSILEHCGACVNLHVSAPACVNLHVSAPACVNLHV